MQTVMYFRGIGSELEIVHEHFQIWDEVRDCRELFDRLNDTLSASWDLMYQQARLFFQTHQHLDVPLQYKTEDGYSLGTWLQTQRRVYAGEIAGRLTPRQIERLDEISMCWEKKSDQLWSKGYEKLLQYKQTCGHLDVPSDYVTEDGFALENLSPISGRPRPAACAVCFCSRSTGIG